MPRPLREASGGENAMIEEKLKLIIKDIGVLNSYLNHAPMPLYILDSPEAIERWKRDSEVNENNNFRIAVPKCANDIISEETNVRGSSSSQLCMTIEGHKNMFSGQSFVQLRTINEEIRNEKDNANDAKNNILRQINPDAKTKWESTRMVTRESSNRVYSWTVLDWEEHERKIRGKEAVLDLFMLYCDQTIAVYDAEIAERKKSPKIKELTKNAASIVKQGEKLKSTIIQSNVELLKAISNNGRPEFNKSKVFINAKMEFEDLSYQHSNLMAQLAFFTNETENVRSFPSLVCADISVENSIKDEWRRYA
jgi:hypothetical protein